MKNTLLALTLIMCVTSLFAQNVKTKGQVIDSVSLEALPSSIITIITRDNQRVVFSGLVENSDGTFMFNKIDIKGAVCDVIIEHMGYKKIVIPFTTHLGVIRLFPKPLLIKEVSVYGNSSIRRSIDKTTYVTDSLDLSKVSVTTDLLRQIPEIAVDELLRTASIMGKKNTLVLQNGINTGKSIDLRTIDFRNIDKVEVITSPSSGLDVQYDAVINILMRPKVKAGLSVDLEQTTKFDFLSNDTYLGATWNKDIISLKFTYSNYYRANPYNIMESRYSMNNTDSYEQQGYAAKPFERTNEFGLNLDYYITSNDFFNITTNSQFVKTDKLIDYSTTPKNDFSSRFTNNYFIGNYTLYYRHSMRSKSTDFLSMTANLGYMNALEDVYSEYKSGREFYNKESADKLSTNLKIEYNNQINTIFKLNAGLQSYYQFFQGKLNSELNDNNFKNYRNNIYADFFAVLGKWNFRVGAKGEINVNDFKNPFYQSTNQFLLQPISTVMYKFNKTHSLLLEYRRPATYPSAWMLAPYTIQVDEKSRTIGNPDLLSTKHDIVQLTYTYRTDMITINSAPVYQRSSNIIIPQKTFDVNLNSTTKFINEGTRYLAGMLLSGSLNFFQGVVSIEPDMFVGYDHTSAGNLVQHNLFYRFGGSANMYLPYGLGVGTYGSYHGKSLSVNGYASPRYSIDAIYILKRFEKLGLNLFLGYQNPSQSADVDYIINEAYTQRNYFKFKSNGFIFRLNYYFNAGKNSKMEKVKTYFDSDKK